MGNADKEAKRNWFPLDQPSAYPELTEGKPPGYHWEKNERVSTKPAVSSTWINCGKTADQQGGENELVSAGPTVSPIRINRWKTAKPTLRTYSGAVPARTIVVLMVECTAGPSM